jgi:NAD(P)-dependent dehydrogenase (short-subunit alcohol dehydrogenase family)
MYERQPRLEGKVAIVTGAGSSGPGVGTGKAISILAAREGCRVLLVDRERERAEETLSTIREEGGEAQIFQGDVTSGADCRRMVEATADLYGRLDILVNNVGILIPGTVLDVEEEDWDRVLDVNLKSMMLTSKYAVPRLIEGGGGSIVNLSSILGLRAGTLSDSAAYSASKGGVIALTTTMAAQLGRQNIRVNAIAPGFLYTPMVVPLVTEEARDLRRRAAPLGTEGTAWDVAWATVFLASDESRWITGVVLPVDGGILATTPLGMFSAMQ